MFSMFVFSFCRCAFQKPTKIPIFLDLLRIHNPAAHSMLTIMPTETKPNRWCEKCNILKTGRIHHCRRSGQCILSFDHYCPWLGACVGIHNYRLFFLQAVYGCACGGFMFVTLGYHFVKSLLGEPEITQDEQNNHHHFKSLATNVNFSSNNENIAPSNNTRNPEMLNSHYRNPQNQQESTEHFKNSLISENDKLKVSNTSHLQDSLNYRQFIKSDWLDNASWIHIVSIAFVLALSLAVFITLFELWFRYFRYIKYNLTFMDDKEPIWDRTKTLSNLKRVDFCFNF